MGQIYIDTPEINMRTPASPTEQHLKVSFVIAQGVRSNFQVDEDVDIVYRHEEEETLVLQAKVYDIKCMVLGDLSKYSKLMRYYVKGADTQFFKLREHIRKHNPGIIDGEIVTLIFFSTEEKTHNGTTATTTCS
ncbi:MAG: hypothetical protein KAS32_27515 [Candidatus Peribacteraceae bacterium]|nr:hypothetical protein [Candidatus Peribacteraceae bacterium]